MYLRRFGKTELQISVLTLGAMRIPEEQGEDPILHHERVSKTLRRGLDLGINHIETARGYGSSEGLIGRALSEGLIKRDEFILTTKIGPTQTAEDFRKNLDDSMNRMKVDYVDILDIHGINTQDLLVTTMQKGGCMEAVQKAIDEKIIGHVGFSTHGPLQVIMDTINTDAFESVNLHYYYFNQYNRPAVDLATEKDMGVFIISPTDKGGLLFNPPKKLCDLCAPYTPIQMNQRWLLSQEKVHTLSLGAAKAEEFDAHLLGVEKESPLTPEEEEIFERLHAALEILGDTYCSFCHACLPCPEDVHIPEVLRLRNMTLAYDMIEFGKYRYKMFVQHDPETGNRVGGAGHWFPGSQGDFCNDCGECLPRCPLNLPIPALLRETHQALAGELGKRLWGDK